MRKLSLPPSTQGEGMVRVQPDRGVSGEGVEAIEGASDGIHVDNQYDQSSNNFQLAGF